jgi:hypothetical protein
MPLITRSVKVSSEVLVAVPVKVVSWEVVCRLALRVILAARASWVSIFSLNFSR